MPNPIPFLLMMIVAILIGGILPALLKACSRHEKVQDSQIPSMPRQTTNREVSSVDPFSDVPDVTAKALRTDEVKTTTKYVKFGNGTEELGFDWLVPIEHPTTKE